MFVDLSVCLCTLNPHTDSLLKVINALHCQTLSSDRWELIIVDNGSECNVQDKFHEYLTWHPNVCFIREENRGYGFARSRAIIESRADLLLFVDDDCVLAEDYLATAKAIMEADQNMGVVTGSVTFLRPSIDNGFVERIHDVIYSSGEFTGSFATCEATRYTPAHRGGAGMVLRRSVALQYAALFKMQSELIHLLDRKRLPQLRYEDIDMVQCALSMGLQASRNGILRLNHVTQSKEMQLLRLLRQCYGIGFNDYLFQVRWQWPSRNMYSLKSIIRHVLQIFYQRTPLERWIVVLLELLGGYRARRFALSNPEFVCPIQFASVGGDFLLGREISQTSSSQSQSKQLHPAAFRGAE